MDLRLTLLACGLALLLAGCTAATPPAEDAQDPGLVPVTEMKRGAAVGPDLNATTASEPRLIEGEWWRIHFTGAFYAQDDLIRVVANATPQGYIFGMPHSSWMKEAIAYHAPAFGNVGRDLSYDVHNERFEPLQFPLVAGKTWQTRFVQSDYTATVESADQYTATVRFDPPPSASPDPTTQAICLLGVPCEGGIRLTYDARLHEVAKMESPIGSWEVIDHGYSFEGWVTVPEGAHTAIDYGVFGPDQSNPLPTRTVHVDDSFNRITVMHAIFAASPGYYKVASTSPDGQTFTTEVVGPATAKFELFEVANPGGDWQQEDVTAGAGGTYTMGIAYQQYDILVPHGDRRPTHSHEVVR
jgi:hypothetical protein